MRSTLIATFATPVPYLRYLILVRSGYRQLHPTQLSTLCSKIVAIFIFTPQAMYVSPTLRVTSICINSLPVLFGPVRAISTLSAIGKSLRESRDSPDRKRRGRTSNPRVHPQVVDRPDSRETATSHKPSPRSKNSRKKSRFEDAVDKKSRPLEDVISRPRSKRRENDLRQRTLPGERYSTSEDGTNDSSDSYWGMPYTTAASEFLFGYFTVVAALKAQKRKLYRLYLHERAMRRDAESNFDALFNLAKEINVPIRHVKDSFLPVMNKTTKDRPHNGVILEASPLPVMPIRKLLSVSRHHARFALELDFQSAEEKAINGTDPHLSYQAAQWRNPFVLFLHEIKNEGNLGSIIRTAYFLGVDAVAIHDRSTASITNGPALKASSGAAEALPILRVGNIDSFLADSAEAGWRIFASVAPSAASPSDSTNTSVALTTDARSPLGFSRGSSSTGANDDSDSDSDSLGFATTLDPLEDLSQDYNSTELISSTITSRSLIPSASPTTNTRAPRSKPPVPMTSLGNPTLHNPSILVLGGEQHGLSRRVLSKCHTQVCIESAHPNDDVGVDSLNVGVAAGLLMQKFVQRPNRPVRVGIGDKVP